jgi:tetratricopeptide (TPR) repeat protein
VRPNHLRILVLGAVLTLGGCAVERDLRHADRAAAAGQSKLAALHYRRALDARPRLASDHIFTTKLQRSSSRAMCDEADAFVARRAWELAVDKYMQAIAADPNFDRAARGLAEANRGLSLRLHERAMHQADRGQMGRAIELLRRAVKVDPQHDAARQALDTAVTERELRRIKARALFDNANVLAAARRWRAAAIAFGEVLAVDASHIAARAALHEAGAELFESESGCRRGGELLKAKSLDKAIATLEQAVATWPFNQPAEALLTKARAQRAEVEQLLTDAEALRAAGTWDQALSTAARARALFPNFAPARTLIATIKEQASGDWVDRGQAFLADGQLAEAAAAAFSTARRYVWSNLAAAQGLAQVSATRGQAHADAGRWGHALLHYMDAAGHLPGQQHYQDKINAARARIINGLSFDVALVVQDAAGSLKADAASLASALHGQVAQRKPGFMKITSQDTEPRYAVEVSIANLDIEQRRVRTERRTHPYAKYHHIPNVNVSYIRTRLHNARQTLGSLRIEVGRACHVCGGRGSIDCATCSGRGHVRCGHCDATGRIVIKAARRTCDLCGGGGRSNRRCDACGGRGRFHQRGRRGHGLRRRHSRGRSVQICGRCQGGGQLASACRSCNGSGYIVIAASSKACGHCKGRGRPNCHTCSGKGRTTCSSCSGRGHGSNSARRRFNDHGLHVSRLQIQLSRTPATVRQSYQASWPYKTHYYRKSGSLDARLTIRHQPDATQIATRKIDQSFSRNDTVIEQANSSIGLHPNALDLPSDSHIRRRLLDGAAHAAAAALLSTVMQDQQTRLEARIAAHLAASELDEVLEARVAAALLLEASNRKAAAKQLDQLRLHSNEY